MRGEDTKACGRTPMPRGASPRGCTATGRRQGGDRSNTLKQACRQIPCSTSDRSRGSYVFPRRDCRSSLSVRDNRDASCPTRPLSSPLRPIAHRSEEHTSELQSLMRISYAVFCLKKKNNKKTY